MKIGIMSLYYKSINYGGILQAYALCKQIDKLITEDDTVEQISYRLDNLSHLPYILTRLSKCIKNIIKFFIHSKRKKMFAHINKCIAFRKFDNEYIPHSKKIYDKNSIIKAANKYDIFITGSDQVWNPQLYQSAFGLEFVDSIKTKASYAASVSQYSLNEEQHNLFNKILKDYDYISVREKISIGLLQPNTQKKLNGF